MKKELKEKDLLLIQAEKKITEVKDELQLEKTKATLVIQSL